MTSVSISSSTVAARPAHVQMRAGRAYGIRFLVLGMVVFLLLLAVRLLQLTSDSYALL